MEKVLVTGATGYIGLHCIQQLLDQGYANGSVDHLKEKMRYMMLLKNIILHRQSSNFYF